MEKKVQYVEFIYGTDMLGIEYNSEYKKVLLRDYKQLNDIPKSCYVYRFFERTEFTASDGEILLGKRRNISGMHYPEGKIMTLKELRKEFPPDHIIFSNMKLHNWDKQVKARNGHFYNLDLEDRIVE